LNTVFAGTVIHSSNYVENCIACGECALNTTMAVCPRARCPKGIVNGPCSEKIDEKCSVNPDMECVWVQISDRRASLGLAENETQFPPTDWATHIRPRTRTST
jgi:hypothetical protein